ncbi:MAG: hypothetical protein KAT38_02850, partial [Bacteroidales bacterium]|nr:hypothetical protein [Bacteroidales bacterium]
MKHSKILITCLFSILCFLDTTGQPRQETFILDEPGFPFIFELNSGESQLITRSYKGKTIEKIIKLDSIRLFTEPNYWFRKPLLQQNYYKARVDLEISGKAVVL